MNNISINSQIHIKYKLFQAIRLCATFVGIKKTHTIM